MNELTALSTTLFGPGVHLEACPPGQHDRGEVHPAEVEVVRGAVATRCGEFLAGRAAARRALAGLGVRGYPLLPDSDRVPVWPRGVVGSISHTRHDCLVGVAREGEVQCLGIDIEPREALEESLWRRVLTARELGFLASRAQRERGVLARLIFCAKEAVYKALFPRHRRFMEFEEVALELDLACQRFEARLLSPSCAEPSVVAGGWRWDARRIVTGVVLAAA